MPLREQTLVVEAITGLRGRLPFPLLGLDTDNDSAFLNDTLFAYCSNYSIEFTRSRAYQKNDQAWVEGAFCTAESVLNQFFGVEPIISEKNYPFICPCPVKKTPQ